jgi:uncharacterized protein YajQ (UPF0234 family)
VRKPVAVLVVLVSVLSGGGFRAAKTKRRVQRRNATVRARLSGSVRPLRRGRSFRSAKTTTATTAATSSGNSGDVFQGASRRRKYLPSCRASHYHFAMPSFDIVSEVNSMEIENAVNQANKELANRFDFRGSKASIVLEKNEIKLSAEDQFKITALVEMVMTKLAKRSISMKNVEKLPPDISPLGHARQVIKIKQGLESKVAKEVTTFIRDSKFKVTSSIQGEEVRVNGKSRDELQAVISAVQAKEFPVSLQFVNFRD